VAIYLFGCFFIYMFLFVFICLFACLLVCLCKLTASGSKAQCKDVLIYYSEVVIRNACSIVPFNFDTLKHVLCCISSIVMRMERQI
jgi:hypothetical protein